MSKTEENQKFSKNGKLSKIEESKKFKTKIVGKLFLNWKKLKKLKN